MSTISWPGSPIQQDLCSPGSSINKHGLSDIFSLETEFYEH